MTGTREMDSNPSTKPDLNKTSQAKATAGKTKEQIDGDLLRVWVRQRLGMNRGEDRPYHGTIAGYDALLDERLALTRKSVPARGVVGG